MDGHSSSSLPSALWNVKEKSALEFKNIGNSLYKTGQYPLAQSMYIKAQHYLAVPHNIHLSSIEEDRIRKLQTSLAMNLALCAWSQNEMQECLEACTVALQWTSTHIKAYYRRSCVYIQQQDYKAACHQVQRALDIEPCNMILQKTMQNILKKQQEVHETEQKQYQKMWTSTT